jgi:hypothetical protein
MPDLYLDVRCDSCGGSHTLHTPGGGGRPPATRYSFRCPATRHLVSFRTAARPAVTAVPPPGAVRARRVPDVSA